MSLAAGPVVALPSEIRRHGLTDRWPLNCISRSPLLHRCRGRSLSLIPKKNPAESNRTESVSSGIHRQASWMNGFASLLVIPLFLGLGRPIWLFKELSLLVQPVSGLRNRKFSLSATVEPVVGCFFSGRPVCRHVRFSQESQFPREQREL